jgi:tetratricopeptide (TPR) repeat protein
MNRIINFLTLILIICLFINTFGVSIDEIMELFGEAKYDEVIKKASELLEEESDIETIAKALYYRGLSYQMFDKMNWAIDDLEMANEMVEGNILYLRALGQLYFEFELEDEAKLIFLDALAIDPSDKSSLIGLGYILLKEDELVSAYNYLEKVKNMGDVPAQVYANLGFIDFKWGNLNSATEYLTKAIEIDPDDLNARFNLGMVLIAREKYNQASDNLLKVVNENPEDIEARLLLAKAYEEGGFKQASITQLENILKLDPDNENVKKWLERLKQ